MKKLTSTICVMIAVYFGIGKTKRIGSMVGLFGMFSLIIILSIINPPTNWIEIGILSTIGISTGITISSLLIFKILSRIKGAGAVPGSHGTDSARPSALKSQEGARARTEHNN